jgi:hypothetical protein
MKPVTWLTNWRIGGFNFWMKSITEGNINLMSKAKLTMMVEDIMSKKKINFSSRF